MNGQDFYIKVCGMTKGQEIQALESMDVDFIGINFYPLSPRYAADMPSFLPEFAHRVGVFVNADMHTICSKAIPYRLEYIQLHGEAGNDAAESPAFCKELRSKGYKIIKAFHISTAKDLEITSAYEECCDYFLFDTKECNSDGYKEYSTDGYKESKFGGTGKSFNWDVLNNYKGKKKFFLSGGIGPDSVKEIKKFSHPKCVGIDINSKFEYAPGRKDVQLINKFIKAIK